VTLGEDFTAFWAAYPRRVGKLDALKAYEKARKVDSAENIMAGVERYKQHLPDEARFVCHPATWLNKGRWMDEEDAPVMAPVKVDCPHDPRCNSKDWCATMREREADGWQRDPQTGMWRQAG
jgi:hypothetical protein